MDKIRCLIADDDPGMRLLLRKIIEKTEDFTVCAEASDGRQALNLLPSDPQICFLDVEMPRMDGIACARALQDYNPRMPLIFATAYDEYMREAFEVYAFDYLIKPFNVARVRATLSRLRPMFLPRRAAPPGAPEKSLIMHNGQGARFVAQSDILLIQREDRETAVYTREGRFTVQDTLSDFHQKLDGGLFFRTHRSYIAKIASIYPYGRWTYILKLRGIEQDALITAERMSELEEKMKN